MKLYYSPGACSLASHITVNELGLPAEVIAIERNNKPPEFARLNPKGYIPFLVTDGGEPLSEGVAILQYLADQRPEKNMIPRAGTWERYKAIENLNFIATEIHKGFGPLWAAQSMVKEAGAQDELKQSAIKKLGTRFDLLAEQLKGKKFLMGDTFTVCDAYLFTILSWTRFHKVDMSKWPSLMGYVEGIQMRPAVQAAMKTEGLLK